MRIFLPTRLIRRGSCVEILFFVKRIEIYGAHCSSSLCNVANVPVQRPNVPVQRGQRPHENTTKTLPVRTRANLLQTLALSKHAYTGVLSQISRQYQAIVVIGNPFPLLRFKDACAHLA